MKITLGRKNLRAIALFAATQDVRHYLNGVYVEVTADETRLVATDGHIAAVIRQDGGSDLAPVAIIVPLSAIKTVAAKGSETVDLTPLDGGNWQLDAHVFKPVDGRFPNYRRVIPRATSGEPGDYSADLCAVFSKAADILLGRKEGGIATYVLQNGGHAAFVGIHGVPDFAGVLMPKAFKVDKKIIEPPPIPAWCAA